MTFANMHKQATTVTSAATVTLGAAVVGFRTLAQVIAAREMAIGATGKTFKVADAAGNWELSEFTVTNSTTLTRTKVVASSNNNAAVAFPAGPKEVFNTVPASYLNGTGVGDLPVFTSSIAGDLVLMYRPGTDTLGVLLASSFGTTTPDTTGPTLSSPTGASTGTTTASGSVTTNEANGTLRYLATANATETVPTVKASGASLAITSTGSKAVSVTGLVAAAQYYLHFVHTDAAGNDSARVTSAAFTTGSAGDTTAPTVSNPTAAQTGSTTATGTVSTNEASGALYRYASTNAVESVPTVKAANLSQPVTATGVQNVNFTGLTAGTTLYAHYVHTDAAGNDSTVANSASFTTASSATAPAAPTIGTASAGDGYVDVAFTLNSNGGSAITVVTATLSTGESATGTTSPIRVTAANGAARTATVTATNTIDTSAPSAASNSVTPAGVVAYTYTPYNGNAVKTTILPSTGTVSGASRYYNGTDCFTNLYVDISPTPASIRGGWSTSATAPPAESTGAENTTSGKLNVATGLTMTGNRINLNGNNLWSADGVQSGPYWFWFKPADGPWYRFSLDAGSIVAVSG